MAVYPYESMDDLVETVAEKKRLVLSVNAEILMNADAKLKHIINNNIGYADGIGVVKMLKKRGFTNAIKIPGCELWLKIIEKYIETSSFYLVGATEETIQQTCEKLKTNYPGINIIGYRNGFIKNIEERQLLIKDVSEKRPDFVFVAMGSPKQELLMDELFEKHEAVYLNLGGSFDVFTGKVKRAPLQYQRLGLEWFYRILVEPSRITRQGARIKYMWYYWTQKF